MNSKNEHSADNSADNLRTLVGKALGQYKVISRLGKGGMAQVYHARQPKMGREVAIKVLTSEDTSHIARFEREARLISELEHPRILPIFDYGRHENILFIAMRFAEGGSLDDKMADKPLSLSECENVIEQLAEALDFAHQKNVIHRDLKPANVFLDDKGNVFLGDFGIARKTSLDSSLTGDYYLGTPLYTSPEQAMGASEVDHLSDIYSLGVILYEMLTGQVPFRAESTMDIIVQHIRDPAPDPRLHNPDLPKPVAEIPMQAMSKTPSDRYATAGLLAEALTEAIAEKPEDLLVQPDSIPTPILQPISTREKVRIPGRSLLPPSPPPYAIPRSVEYDEVKQFLIDSDHPIIALRGLGGVGKTVLIRQLARDPDVAEYFVDGILYSSLGPDLNDESDADPILLSWSKALGFKTDLQRFSDTHERSAALASLLESQKRLLIIDDVWSLDPANLLIGTRNPESKVIISTRALSLVIGLGAREFEMGNVSSNDAQTLVEKRLGKELSIDDRTIFTELAERLGYLPIALSLMAAQVQHGASWSELLEEFQDDEPDIGWIDLPELQKREFSLDLTFRLSYEALGDSLQKYFTHLGVLPAKAMVNADAAAAIWNISTREARQSLRKLTDYSLMEPAWEGNWQMHQLVWTAARQYLNKDPDKREKAILRHAEYILSLAGELQDATQMQQTRPHIISILARAKRGYRDEAGYAIGSGDEARRWLLNTASVVEERWKVEGFYQEQIQWLKEAFEAARELGEISKQADIARRMARVFGKIAKYDDAYEWMDKGRELLPDDAKGDELRVLGLIDVHTASLRLSQGEFTACHELCQQAIDRLKGSPHEGVLAEGYMLMGVANAILGEMSDAAEAFQESMLISEKLGNDYAATRARDNLATLHFMLGKFESAHEFYSNNLKYWERLGDRDNIARAQNNLAGVHLVRGKIEDAERLYKMALTTWNDLNIPRSVLEVQTNLGWVKAANSEWSQAQSQAEEAIEVGTRSGARESLSEAYRCLAWSLLGSGQTRRARIVAEQAVYLAVQAHERLDEGAARRVLGATLNELAIFDEAQAEINQSLEILQSIPVPLEAARSQLALAIFYQGQDQIELARDHGEAACEAFAKLGARIDLDTAQSLGFC